MSEITVLQDAQEGWGFRPVLVPEEFPRTGWGHRGYDEAAVDTFVRHAQDELAAANDQVNDLRLEVDRLHRYIRRQWAAVAAAESARSPSGDHVSQAASPAAQARAVLTQAQEIAERRLADAGGRLAEAEHQATALLARADRQVGDRLAQADELMTRRIHAADLAAGERLDRADMIANEVLTDAQQAAMRKRSQAQEDARRLLSMAQSRYEDIVIRAHQRADQAAEMALHDFEETATTTGDAGRARVALEMKAAYLRTFAKVSRTALTAALDLSGREFDRLLTGTAVLEALRLGGQGDDVQTGVQNLVQTGVQSLVQTSVPNLVQTRVQSGVPNVVQIDEAAAGSDGSVYAVPGQLGYPSRAVVAPHVVAPQVIVLPDDEVIGFTRVTRPA